MRSVKSVDRTGHTPKQPAQWAHSSSESTVHTVGQCKPTDYLCEVEGALALGRRRGLGLGPVDAASRGELEITYSTLYNCCILLKEVHIKLMLCWAFNRLLRLCVFAQTFG